MGVLLLKPELQLWPAFRYNPGEVQNTNISSVEVTFMPLFEFRCPPCERDFELLVRNGEQAVCPHCGSKSIEKLLSEAAAPAASSARSLPIASTCPPGDAPCGPRCCRL